MKIGPVDTEIALLRVKQIKKKEEITEGKIYSPFGKFAERAKKILTLLSIVFAHDVYVGPKMPTLLEC